MTKTAQQVISQFLQAFSGNRDSTEQGYRDLMADLAAAGLVIVPNEPTETMLDASDAINSEYRTYVGAELRKAMYSAMIAAGSSRGE